ncbi:hypothetical protein ACOEI2_003880 [Shigella flexneri]
MVKEFLVSKENKPSYECMNTAETCLGLAGMASEDWQREHHCRTGIIFTAFAIEAMFIFYRKQVDPGYDKTQKECRKSAERVQKDNAQEYVKIVRYKQLYGDKTLPNYQRVS